MPHLDPPPRSRSLAASSDGRPVLVVTSDPVLDRHLLSVVAAVGLRPEEPSTDEDLRRSWRSAGAVLVGVDQAASLLALALPPRREVFVVGRDDDRAGTHAWSTRLRAAVATLPDGARALADALSDLAGETAADGLLAVVGGSGGVGASTLAAALALSGARDDRRTFLLDADPAGGGLDVLLGIEQLGGWRWSRFVGARGHLGDLGGQLPHCDGVDVLSVDRGITLDALGPEQVGAVLDAATRTHDLVVADLPRQPCPAQEEVVRRANGVLVVVRADVRGVAAAVGLTRALALGCRRLEVVVRTGRGRTLAPDLVADTLDLPLAGVLQEDAGIPVAAERGEPPGQLGRNPLARLCGRLLDARDGVAA